MKFIPNLTLALALEFGLQSRQKLCNKVKNNSSHKPSKEPHLYMLPNNYVRDACMGKVFGEK